MSLPLPVPSVRTVTTRLFGVLQVADDTIIQFADGLPGFEDAHQFVYLPAAVEGTGWLQSLDRTDLAFFLVEARRLSSEAFGDTPDLMAIVTLPGAGRPQATANLRAPLLLARQGGPGHQLIGLDETWSTTHPVDLATLLP